VICFISKSTSCTLNRNASSNRNPLPYSNFTTNCGTPVIAVITFLASSAAVGKAQR
jgi:hypothetical protein